MNDAATANRVRIIRRCRAVLAAVLVLEAARVAFDVIRDSVLPVAILFVMVLHVLVICFQTMTIRRTREAARRPDYLLISAMECEIYGETFEHAGSSLSDYFYFS